LNSRNEVVSGICKKVLGGGGSTWEMMPFGDHQGRLVIALSASADRLAAM